MRLVILNYTGYRANWGSQATSRGLLQFLRSVVDDPAKLDIDILPYPPSHFLDQWQSLKHSGFLRDIYADPSPGKGQLFKLEQLCNSRFGDRLKRIAGADIVFFQGEGALGGGREFRRTQILGPLVLAKHLYGKTTISINQTIAYESETARTALQAIFRSLDLNFVRELESLEKCSGVGWPAMAFLPDAAFFYRPKPFQNSLEGTPRYFCVTGSASLESYDLNAYVEGIRSVARRWNLHPVFAYSRTGDARLVDAYRKIGESDFSVVTAASHPDVDQMIAVLKDAAVVIGGRYHTSISALSQSVPVILTASNSHKSRGLARMFGNDDIRLVDNPSPETLNAAMEAVMADHGALKTRLQAAAGVLSELARGPAGQIKDLIANTPHAGDRKPGGTYPDPGLDAQRNRLSFVRAFSLSRNLGCYDRPRLLGPAD